MLPINSDRLNPEYRMPLVNPMPLNRNSSQQYLDYPKSMNKNNGFTILELMITLAIAGILATIAAPSFTSMIQNNRQATQINTLLGALNFARSEAIKRGIDVVLCRSANMTACANTGGWEQGWIIFVDTNDDNNRNAGETILRVYGALAGGNTLRSNTNYINRVVYQSNGFTTQVGTFVLCDDRDSDGDVLDNDDFTNGSAVIINRTGRARSADTTGMNGNCTAWVTP